MRPASPSWGWEHLVEDPQFLVSVQDAEFLVGHLDLATQRRDLLRCQLLSSRPCSSSARRSMTITFSSTSGPMGSGDMWVSDRIGTFRPRIALSKERSSLESSSAPVSH